MDVQLQELVDRIKKDGVASADAEASRIRQEAQKEAEHILKNAKAEAEKMIQEAQKDADRLESAAVSSIKQSGRNILISFRDSVTAEISTLIKNGVSSALSADTLKELVPSVVKAWASRSSVDDLAVLLSKEDMTKLESSLVSTLKAEISAGLELTSDGSLSSGFRLGMKDGSAYYDFSAEAVASLFSAYLNPRVAQILASAAKEL